MTRSIRQRRGVLEQARTRTRREAVGQNEQTPREDNVWASASPQPLRHVDQRWLRRNNRALVLACIREHGPISRVRIAQRTELSRTTVSAIARALLQEGVIREGARSCSTKRGGRRAILLHATAG
ncbi:MAG TPA: winged helix-turn-helix transcriptional regulator [Ktedonobacterales bacterium]|nr:winged helix-turn-helix transcriptional regulator [Ktedonobacterales bacterium]